MNNASTHSSIFFLRCLSTGKSFQIWLQNRKENQNNKRTASLLLLIECLLSLTLILGLNCVSLGMTRINKLWGVLLKTNQFWWRGKGKTLRTLSVEIINDDLNFRSRCWHTQPHHILAIKAPPICLGLVKWNHHTALDGRERWEHLLNRIQFLIFH